MVQRGRDEDEKKKRMQKFEEEKAARARRIAEGKIRVRLQEIFSGESGRESYWVVKEAVVFERLIEGYKARFYPNWRDRGLFFRLQLDGNWIDPSATPQTLELEDDYDTLDMYVMPW